MSDATPDTPDTTPNGGAAGREVLATVLDSLPRAIVLLDDGGAITRWNREAVELTGRTPEEVLGRCIIDVVVRPEDAAIAREVIVAAAADVAWSGDLLVCRSDDTTVRIAAHVGPVGGGDPTMAVVVTAADVTAQRALERQVVHGARHLALALEAGQLGTWVWDMASGTTTWDAQMERLFGLAEGEFDGTFEHWVRMLHPDDVDSVLVAVQAAVDEREAYSIVHRIVRPDGSVRWVHGRGNVTFDDAGHVAGTIGCTADITDQKLADEARDHRLQAAERLASVERLQRERLEFLTSLNDVARGAADHREIMRVATQAAVPSLGDWCTLYFVPERGVQPEVELAHADPARVQWARELQERFPYDPEAPTGIAAVIRSGRTEFIPAIGPELLERVLDQDTRHDRDQLRALLDELELTSIITVPLVTKRGVIGAIRFVSAESGREYDADDVSLAQAAAGRLAVALESAWTVARHRTISETLQSALLPPVLPEIGGVEVAARYWAAGDGTEVGGDFYDVFRIADHRWGVLIGDVCGTGPAAAAVTSIARHTVRAAATHGADHAEVVRWLNEAVIAGGRGRYCTVAYGTLEGPDPETGRWAFTVAAGGHPLPRRIRAGQVDRIGTPGTLVGVLAEVRVHPTTIELEPGDLLVLHTDGITDVAPPHTVSDEMFDGVLRAVAARHPGAPAFADALGDAIDQHLAIRRRVDDVAVVVIGIDR